MATQLFGIIGHPVEHSLSPLMHNAAFEKLGLDFSYSAFDIKPQDLESFYKTCRSRFAGFNVTIPHKVKSAKHMDVLDESARLIGAVNTVKNNDGVLAGYNTDGVGAIKALLGAREKVAGRRVLILGSGGAARAIAFQCALEGAEVALSNRTMEAAMELSKDIRDKLGRRVLIVNYSEKSLRDIMPGIDILVNATSVGMHPKPRRTPIEPSLLREDLVVMDIVYNPLETNLLNAAKRAGCKTIDGVGMLVHQGSEAFKIWTKKEAPVEEMRKAVLKALAK